MKLGSEWEVHHQRNEACGVKRGEVMETIESRNGSFPHYGKGEQQRPDVRHNPLLNNDMRNIELSMPGPREQRPPVRESPVAAALVEVGCKVLFPVSLQFDSEFNGEDQKDTCILETIAACGWCCTSYVSAFCSICFGRCDQEHSETTGSILDTRMSILKS